MSYTKYLLFYFYYLTQVKYEKKCFVMIILHINMENIFGKIEIKLRRPGAESDVLAPNKDDSVRL